MGQTPRIGRSLLLLLALCVPAVIVAAAGDQPAAVPPVAQTKETQAAITPQIALQMLKDGNARFTSGRLRARDPVAQVKATAGGQYPFASVLSCIDSRSAPELVFVSLGRRPRVAVAGSACVGLDETELGHPCHKRP
jgi:carbonic anhydrase